jgi:hypothetical protein
MTQSRTNPLESPFCADFRSKRYYFLERPAYERSEILDGSGDCWCGRTQLRLGPDDERVDPDDCQRGRACFRSASEPIPTAGPLTAKPLGDRPQA